MVLRHLLKICGAFAFCLLISGGVRAEVSVAYVDSARLLKDAPQVERIRHKIREEFVARDERLVEMRKQIALLEARLVDEDERMSDEEKRLVNTDLGSRRIQLKQARDELEQDKQLRFSEEEQHFSRVIHEVIQQVAQDDKLDLVLQGGVFWVSPKVDITDRILARLREMLANGN